MSGTISPRSLRGFVERTLGLAEFLRHPGDGRRRPQIPARDLIWSQLVSQVLRILSFHAIEGLLEEGACRALGISRRFGDDALGYFNEHLGVGRLREALHTLIRNARRNKAFRGQAWIGLALDGTCVGHCEKVRCPLCHPIVKTGEVVHGAQHKLSMASIVGGDLRLTVDVEPYGPGSSEQAAGHTLLKRIIEGGQERFFHYVVGDGLYGNAPFLHLVEDLGLWAVVRLKENLPELARAAASRFDATPPDLVLEEQGQRIEIWDRDDFDPWDSLRWRSVRVLRYRQHKRGGEVVDAAWLTNAPKRTVRSQALYRMAKSRWQIENEGFNDAKNRHGMNHVCHHEQNSLIVGWLITALALCIERLWRLRHLKRGGRAPMEAAVLVRKLTLALGRPSLVDTG